MLTVFRSYLSGWAFSSEMRTLLAHPTTKTELNTAIDSRRLESVMVHPPRRCGQAKNGRVGIVNAPARDPGCGDASACLKLRPPVIRRDRETYFQDACPPEPAHFPLSGGRFKSCASSTVVSGARAGDSAHQLSRGSGRL